MADVKISALPSATTPLAGTEVLPIVQSATTDQVSVANLTAGRSVSAASLTLTTTPLAVGSGGTGLTSLTAGWIPYGDGTNAFGNSANLQFNGTAFAIGGTLSSWAIPAAQLSRGSLFADTGSLALNHNLYFDGAQRYIASSQGALQFQMIPGTGFLWQIAPSGTAGNAISFTQAMTLDASGNLGIGIAPSYKLDVTSSSVNAFRLQPATGTDSINMWLTNTGGSLYLGRDNSAGSNWGSAYASVIWSQGAYPLIFATNNTARARIDSDGNLLVATTSPWTTPAGSKVYATGGFAVGNSANFSELAFDRINFKVSVFYVLNDVSTGVKLTSGDTAWAAQSDIRLKDVIGTYTDAVKDILKIEPIKYVFKNDTDKQRVGVSAQSVQIVIPEAISVDEDGYLSVKYTEILPLMIASIQELAAKVAELEAKI